VSELVNIWHKYTQMPLTLFWEEGATRAWSEPLTQLDAPPIRIYGIYIKFVFHSLWPIVALVDRDYSTADRGTVPMDRKV